MSRTPDPDVSPEERARRDAINARKRRYREQLRSEPEPDGDTLDRLADDVAEEALRLARGKLFGFASDESEP